MREERLANLPRRREDERPTVIRPEVGEVAYVKRLDGEDFKTEGTTLFIRVLRLVEWGVDRWIQQAVIPSSKTIPALQMASSTLTLRLVGTRDSSAPDGLRRAKDGGFSGPNLIHISVVPSRKDIRT